MVARSKAPTGPFETLEQAKGRAAQPDAVQDERWLAPGHTASSRTRPVRPGSSITHRREPPAAAAGGRDNSRRILLIDKIEWRDGWPFVGTPSDEPQTALRYLRRRSRWRSCEHLALRLNSAKQRSSTCRVPSATDARQQADLGVPAVVPPGISGDRIPADPLDLGVRVPSRPALRCRHSAARPGGRSLRPRFPR